MSNHTVFTAYRYQLLPLDRNHTKDLYNDYSPENIIANKNKYFKESLINLPLTSHKKGRIKISIANIDHDFFKMQLAPSRPLTRETHDHKRERVDNWPHIDAYILNHKDDQFLIIQDRVTAFANTNTVANIITQGTKSSLERIGLSLHIEPLFNESFFWDLVRLYNNRVSWVEFEFVTPNMANISQTLADTLKSIAKETNAVKEQLTLRADPISSLDISEDNTTIKGLVDYTSQGAGNIKLKMKGIRKHFQTSSSKKKIRLSEIELSGSPSDISEFIRNLLK